MTGKTFFSYSRTDTGFVLKLAKDLRDAGVDLWLDQLDIKAGSRWDASIESALDTANRMIVVLSTFSISSNNVMDEVSFALESNKDVIPVLLSECKVPFRLKRLQHIDFTGSYEGALNQLLEVLGYPGGVKKAEGATLQPLTVTETIAPVPPVTHPKEVSTAPPVKNIEREEDSTVQVSNKKRSSNKYFFIGGGVVVTALIVWAVMHSGSDVSPETQTDSTAVSTPATEQIIDTTGTRSLLYITDTQIAEDSLKYHKDYGELIGLSDSYGDIFDYKGGILNGKANGYGSANYQNGDKYIGTFKDNLSDGKGKYIWKLEGKIYEGDFKNDKKTGKGTYIFKNGDKCIGEFLNGLSNGYGEYVVGPGLQINNCPNATIYKGYYKNDLKSGTGKCYDKNGKLIYEGLFKNNKPVDEYPSP